MTQQICGRNDLRGLPRKRQHLGLINRCIVPIAGLHFQHYKLRERARKVRLEVNRASTCGDGVLEMAVTCKESGKCVMGFGKVRLKSKGPNIMARGRVKFMSHRESVAEVIVD